MILKQPSKSALPRLDSPRTADITHHSISREKRKSAVTIPGKAIANYLLWSATVIAGSLAIFDLYSSPARIARQNTLNTYAPSASVALITRHCGICNEP
jgi:hypothetical protein